MTEQPLKYTLVLTAEELSELAPILEQMFQQTHAERRRTEAPTYREELRHEETVLERLVNKVRQLRA